MSNQFDSPEQLRSIIEALEQERIHLQIVGRPLSPQEEERCRRIEVAVPLLHKALTTLIQGVIPDLLPEPQPTVLHDGCYEGGNDQVYMNLRLDEKVSGVISADLFRIGPEGRSYVASIRTTPGEHIALADRSWIIIGQDKLNGSTTGRLSLEAQNLDDKIVTGSLFLNSALHGLPVQRDIRFVAEWKSEYPRTVGIEVEYEEEVSPPTAYNFNDEDMTVEAALRDAGIGVVEVGEVSRIPATQFGWGTSQLHTLMQDFAQAPLTRRVWELHLLILSRSTRSGLLGIMFDTGNKLPRQGAAVFASTIRGISGIQHDRKLIQTIVHELGHALNLAHRFERVVGRADSTSFMNYDWRYKGGNHRNEFWSKFAFTFDSDELEFLRHAPLPHLIPGGAAFHSVNYWADGNGGYSPYLPEEPLEDFRLSLSPPLGGPVFTFAQPIFLQVELTNLTGEPIDIPPVLLDPKAGFLEILIRRRTGDSPSDLAGARVFVPIVQRCFDIDPRVFETVQHGESIRNNLNLTYGSGGFAFAEPGEYDVTALIAIYDKKKEVERIIRSEPLRIRVGFPKTTDEENDALVLFQDNVGTYLALGGSDGLEDARDVLEEIRKRRQGKDKVIRDPIVANIVRCEGINAGRPYVRFREGQFEEKEGNRERAADLLASLGNRALRAFDAHTAEHTKRLAEKHRNALHS